MEETKKPFNKQEYDNKYIKNNYDRLNFVMPKGTKDRINQKAREEGTNASEYLRKVILDSLEASTERSKINIPDLAAYARSAKLTEEEYIKAAVLEKMQKQDAEYTEDVTRVKF